MASDRVDEANRSDGLFDVVHPDNVCTVENSSRCRGQTAFRPSFRSGYFPDEAFAGSANEDGPTEAPEFPQPTQYLKVVIDRLAEAQTWVQYQPVPPHPRRRSGF